MTQHGLMNHSNSSVQDVVFDQGDGSDLFEVSPIFLIIELCLAGFGAILNLMVMLASLISLKARVMRATPFMISLGISDLIICTFTMTMNTLINAGLLKFNDTKLGDFFCTSISAINVIVASSSSFTVLLIAIDRYLCVSYPLDFIAMVPQKRLVCILLLIWAICFVLGILPIFIGAISLKDIEKVGGRCMMDTDPVYKVVMVMVIIIIPCFTITIIYGKILHIFQQYAIKTRTDFHAKDVSRQKVEHESITSFQVEINKMSVMFSSAEEPPTIQEKPMLPSVLSDFIKRFGKSNFTTSVTLTCIVITFLLHWLPFGVINMINVSSPGTVPYNIRRGCMWLLLMNSCWNPIIYTLSSPKIKSDCLRCMGGCCCCRCCGCCPYRPSIPVLYLPPGNFPIYPNNSTSFMFPNLLKPGATTYLFDMESSEL